MTEQQKRIIAVEVDRSMAERVAHAHREAGYLTRIYPRTVRASGLNLTVLVVVEEGRKS